MLRATSWRTPLYLSTVEFYWAVYIKDNSWTAPTLISQSSNHLTKKFLSPVRPQTLKDKAMQLSHPSKDNSLNCKSSFILALKGQDCSKARELVKKTQDVKSPCKPFTLKRSHQIQMKVLQGSMYLCGACLREGQTFSLSLMTSITGYILKQFDLFLSERKVLDHVTID